jgi:hypothetical protein
MPQWLQWLLIVVIGGPVLAIASTGLLYLSRLVALAVWHGMPNGRLKNLLFKEGGEPLPGALPPWVKRRIIKSFRPTNRISPPPEYISAEEFEERKQGDRQ